MLTLQALYNIGISNDVKRGMGKALMGGGGAKCLDISFKPPLQTSTSCGKQGVGSNGVGSKKPVFMVVWLEYYLGSGSKVVYVMN